MFDLLNPNLPPIHLFTFKDIPFRISRYWNVFVLAFSIIGGLSGGLPGFIGALSLILLVYFFVSVHEYGHGLTANYMNVRCEHITLWPLAGLASIDIVHDDPKKEWWVTFNGPLTNAIWCVIFYPLMMMFNYAPDMQALSFFASLCFKINLGLLLFNLLPVHPMDGGRLFRSGLQLLFRVEPLKAAKITAFVGIATAAVGSIVAIQLGYYMVAVMLPIAAYVGYKEYMRSTQQGQRQAFQGRHRQAMTRDTIRPDAGSDSFDDLITRTESELEKVERLLRRR